MKTKAPSAARSGWRWLKSADLWPYVDQLAEMEAALQELRRRIEVATLEELLTHMAAHPAMLGAIRH